MKYRTMLICCCLSAFFFIEPDRLAAQIEPGAPATSGRNEQSDNALSPARQRTPSPREKGQEYQQAWCLEHRGQVNTVLFDKTICDCLTDTHAITFTLEQQWNEGLGQALYQAMITGKNPGLVVFTEQEEKEAAFLQLIAVIKYYNLPVRLWQFPLESEESAQFQTNQDASANTRPVPSVTPTPRPKPTPSQGPQTDFLLNDFPQP